MNINAAAPIASPAPRDSGPSAFESDTFIQLLMAQLKAQDPFDPLKPNEMIAQLTQVSTLQELIRIRQAVEG